MIPGVHRAVLITGASTGIGEACALSLAARGWRVFAGVRKTQDGDALMTKGGAAITPILLDVTNPDHIEAAVALVRGETGANGLHGLVNNAGVAVAGPLESMPLKSIRRQFDVNVFGTIAVTQAFLPLVRAARGRQGGRRIVLMSSNSGFWCEPFLAAYGATKHSLEAIGDSLRVELAAWGIEVVLIEPGMIRTPIWEKSRAASERLVAAQTPECRELYARPLEALRTIIEKASGLAIPPERVARAVCHALESRHPKTRYPIGVDSRAQSILRHWLPDRLKDRIARWVMKI